MIVDALLYSMVALMPTRRALKPVDPYWRIRLLLSLLLANQGLCFAGIAAVVGAVYIDTQPQAANAIEVLCFLTCVYIVLTVFSNCGGQLKVGVRICSQADCQSCRRTDLDMN